MALLGMLCLLALFEAVPPRRDMFVNYQTGAMKAAYGLGPLDVFSKVSPPNAYESIDIAPPENEAIDSAWHLAGTEEFRLSGTIFYDYPGGHVASAVIRLGLVLPKMPKEQAQTVKNQYRKMLFEQGPFEASEYADLVFFDYVKKESLR